jgi:phosphonate metabolism protein (transferase hexapeptide repeat family)
MHYIERHVPAVAQGRLGKQLSEQPTIHEPCYIIDSYLGGWTEIGRETIIMESRIGDYSYNDSEVSVVYTDVGKFASIASHVRINPGNHPMDRVSQHHFTYRRKQYGFDERDDAAFFEWRRAHRCQIGHDVWLGHAVTVMPGVKIGTGAVIGAGAVVTKDIDPYTIAVGVPAKPVRKRFADDVIAHLLRIAWWDWDRAVLQERFQDFLDLPTFLEKYKE